MNKLPTEIRLTVTRELSTATRDVNRLIAAINAEIATREIL